MKHIWLILILAAMSLSLFYAAPLAAPGFARGGQGDTSANDGIIPAANQRIKEGTRLRGKCQPPAVYPHLAFEDKTSDPSSIAPPGTKHHVDGTTSEFFRLTADGPSDLMGSTRWALGDTIEEMKNVIYKCKTSPSPLILGPGRYRMIVTREVFDATFSNINGWVDPPVDERQYTKENVDFEVAEPCFADDPAADASSCMTASALTQAMDRSLGTRKLSTPPCYLRTQQKDPKFMTYNVRLGKDNNLLPTEDWIKKHFDSGDLSTPQEGGRYMLLGAVQQVGDTYRVTMRIMNVETSAIVATSKGDGHGCPDGLQQAVEAALSGLNVGLQPYR